MAVVIAALVVIVGCGTSSGRREPGPDARTDVGGDAPDVAATDARDVTQPSDVAELEASDVTQPSDVAEPDGTDVTQPSDVAEPDGTDVTQPFDVAEPEGGDVTQPFDVAEPDGTDVTQPTDAAEPDGTDVTQPPDVAEAAPEQVEPPSVYPTFAAARFDGVPLPKKVPGVRLFLSYTGDDGDAPTCGAVTWRLGNRVVLSGTSPDGVGRGRLTGATLFVDVDEQDPDLDVYPTVDGELRPYPFVVDVLDQDHQRLWRGRLREPIQIREYVARAMEEKAGMEFSPLLAPLVSSVLHADLEALSIVVPDLPGARYVRFSRDLSFAERLSLAADPACPLDPDAPLVIPADAGDGPQDEVLLSALPEVPLATLSGLTPEIEVVRVAGNADPAEAVNVAILADGFRVEDKAAFVTHAQAVADTLLNQEPYASLAARVNVWRVWTPSVEAGVAYDCDCPAFGAPGTCASPSPDCKDALRDTVYGSDFVIRSVFKLLGTPPDPQADRMIVPLHLARVALAMSLSADDGTPVSADAAFVLANSSKEAAFGLFYAAITTAYATTGDEAYLGEVATHEFGHAFGLLGDEYHTASDICQVFDLTPLFPNFSPLAADAAGLAWAPWVTLAPPYPNTEDQGTAADVGCFVPAPGGGLCVDDQGQPLVCRAQKTCKMKTNEGDFCAVCRDHVLKRIFARVDLLRDALFTLTETGAGTFQVDTGVTEAAVETTWSLDGVAVQQTPAFAPFELDVAALEPGPHELALEVRYVTPFVRLWSEGLRERMTALVTVP